MRLHSFRFSVCCSGGKFISVGEKIRLPDDVTMGYIIGKFAFLKLPLSGRNSFPSPGPRSIGSGLNLYNSVEKNSWHLKNTRKRQNFKIGPSSGTSFASGLSIDLELAKTNELVDLECSNTLNDISPQTVFYTFLNGSNNYSSDSRRPDLTRWIDNMQRKWSSPTLSTRNPRYLERFRRLRRLIARCQ